MCVLHVCFESGKLLQEKGSWNHSMSQVASSWKSMTGRELLEQFLKQEEGMGVGVGSACLDLAFCLLVRSFLLCLPLPKYYFGHSE